MKELIASFANHLRDALVIGENADLKAPEKQVQNIIITGLGGSGIGGKIVSQLVEGEAKAPIALNNNYFLPGYVDDSTLVIVSSYSGNTEETLSAMELALKQNAQVICITSNGKLLDAAQARGFNHIVIPGGMPPRAAFGYSFTQLFFVLQHYGIIGSGHSCPAGGFKHQIEAAIELLDAEEEAIRKEARNITGQLAGKVPVIYGPASCEGVCVRFRQQLNENAKTLAWHHVFPELNHNELVGWTKGNEELGVVIFRNDDDFERTRKRMNISKEIFRKYTSTIIEINSKGKSAIEKALYLIHLGDWVSFFLAEKKGIDANEVNVIDYLKSELAKY